MNRGIVTLFISPLLALASSDQMQRKLQKKTANIPHMGSVLLAAGMKPSTIKTIADDISHMRDPATGDTAGAMIIFTSPQFLVGARGGMREY